MFDEGDSIESPFITKVTDQKEYLYDATLLASIQNSYT